MKGQSLAFPLLLSLCLPAPAEAQYNSINFDYETAAVMAGEYNAAAAAEVYYESQVRDILGDYGTAEIAAAGIYTSKHLDRKALTDLGIWTSASENHYYQRIYKLVSARIVPQLWGLAGELVHYPDKAFYWGGYLTKTCTEVQTLCHQFESVVTNGRLSFGDITFLKPSEGFASLTDLSTLGGRDWERLLQSNAYTQRSGTRGDLADEIGTFGRLVSRLAATGDEGSTGNLTSGCSFDGTFLEKARSVGTLAGNLYQSYMKAERMLDTDLEAYWGDNPRQSDILSLASYGMKGWVSDYLSSTTSTCYTQRYYIVREDKGSEQVTYYSPPFSTQGMTESKEWMRFPTDSPENPPTSDMEMKALANSESHAGWSREKVNALNAQNTGYTYTFSTYLYKALLPYGSDRHQWCLAYSITINRTWSNEEVVYEETFDSQSMEPTSFLAHMNEVLAEYNENDEGKTYVLRSGERSYYQPATGEKVRGCDCAIIMMTCTDDFDLAKGDTQYKCKGCGSSLNAHSRECAMKTTLTADDMQDDGLEQLAAMKAGKEQALRQANEELAALLEDEAYLKQCLRNLSEDDREYGILQAQLAELKKRISSKRSEIAALEKQLQEVDNAIAAASEPDVETDDYYRIPAIMKDVQDLFKLKWQEEGWWSGYTFHRRAESGTASGTVTFKASLSLVRKPQYLLGIRIHRAILKISWSLDATYTQSEVVGNISFDSGMSDEEKAATVNRRLAELSRDFPGCTTDVQYIRSEEDGGEEDTEDTYHLLWASDRLDMAREVEARLMNIYTDIVSMRKMMHYRLSILDTFGGILPHVDTEQGRKRTMAEKCRRRWLKTAADRYHSPGYNGRYDTDEDD